MNTCEHYSWHAMAYYCPMGSPAVWDAGQVNIQVDAAHAQGEGVKGGWLCALCNKVQAAWIQTQTSWLLPTGIHPQLLSTLLTRACLQADFRSCLTFISKRLLTREHLTKTWAYAGYNNQNKPLSVLMYLFLNKKSDFKDIMLLVYRQQVHSW